MASPGCVLRRQVLLGCALVLGACAQAGAEKQATRTSALSSSVLEHDDAEREREPLPDVDAATPHSIDPPLTPVHEVQGRSHRSPYEGRGVAVEGAVTMTRDSGFWLADEQPDDDPVTSEGLFVYTGDPPTVRVAMRVRVTGVVSEYRPGCVRCGEQASAHDNLTVTELAQVTALEVAQLDLSGCELAVLSA